MALSWREGPLVRSQVGFIRLGGTVRVRLLKWRSCWLVTGIRGSWKRFGGIRKVSSIGSLNRTRTQDFIFVLLICRNSRKAFRRNSAFTQQAHRIYLCILLTSSKLASACKQQYSIITCGPNSRRHQEPQSSEKTFQPFSLIDKDNKMLHSNTPQDQILHSVVELDVRTYSGCRDPLNQKRIQNVFTRTHLNKMNTQTNPI